MRFMIIVKATKDSEAGVMPEEALRRDGAYHEELAKAGVLLDGSGLQPSAKGWRIKYSGDKTHLGRRSVRRDQGADRRLHAHPGEVAGRGAWNGRGAFPIPRDGEAGEIEVRQLFELEDFARASRSSAFATSGCARKVQA